MRNARHASRRKKKVLTHLSESFRASRQRSALLLMGRGYSCSYPSRLTEPILRGVYVMQQCNTPTTVVPGFVVDSVHHPPRLFLVSEISP